MTGLKRMGKKSAKSLGLILCAIVCSLLAGAVFLLLAGFHPLEAYAGILAGAFGSKTAITQTLTKATPLLLIGVGVAVAFKGSSFNIGAEGQFYAGTLGCVLCEIALHNAPLPSWLMITACLLSAFLFGGIWGAIPGYFKAARGASEVVASVMLSSVMVLLVKYLVGIGGPIAEPRGIYPETQEIAQGARLPYLLSGTRLHLGFLIALAAAVLIYLFLERTTWGYKIKATGRNAGAAKYGGINVGMVTVSTMALSGGIAGLAGGIEVLGTAWKLYPGLSPGYGYNAIAVALLGRLHPIGIIFSALLFGMLNTGSNQMARSAGIPSTLAAILQALVLLFVVGFSIFEQKSLFVRKKGGAQNG